MLPNLRNRLETQWKPNVPVAVVYGAVLFRTLIIYQQAPALTQALLLWAASLALSMSLPALTRRWRGYFPVYLLIHTGLLMALLRLPVFPDYFSVMFSVLSVQIVEHYSTRTSALLIALFTPIILVLLIPSVGVGQAIALGVFYTGINILMPSLESTVQRAQRAREQNQALVRELAESNQQLQEFAHRVEGLAVTRERSELARELHDSVTQTIFSMTLASKSALMLVEMDFSRVGSQIDRLDQLAQSAQAEMRVLIAELGQAKPVDEDLETLLRRHLQLSPLPENLTVELEASGAGTLTAQENRNLFRIVQEALNNTIKHAQASRATIRLHLDAPLWVEIEDNGTGFDPQQLFDHQHIGLSSMRERAAAIHWEVSIHSAPGANTRIRLAKLDTEGATA